MEVKRMTQVQVRTGGCDQSEPAGQCCIKYGVSLQKFKEFLVFIKKRQKSKMVVFLLAGRATLSVNGVVNQADEVNMAQVMVHEDCTVRVSDRFGVERFRVSFQNATNWQRFPPNGLIPPFSVFITDSSVPIVANQIRIMQLSFFYDQSDFLKLLTALEEALAPAADQFGSDHSSEDSRSDYSEPEFQMSSCDVIASEPNFEVLVDTAREGEGLQGEGDWNLNVSISETSKGGLKYEVILGESKVVTPPRVKSPPLANVKPAISAELIELRINAAAERRQSLEAERLAALALKFCKVEEVAKKKEDGEASFINSTKENLELKMETSIGNRETRIADLKTKLSTHNVGRQKEVRQNLTEHEEKVKQELEAKLEATEKNREKLIQEKLEALKKHDEHVEMIRKKRNSLCDQKTDGEERKWWIMLRSDSVHDLQLNKRRKEP